MSRVVFLFCYIFYMKHLALEPVGLGVGPDPDLSVETEPSGKVLTD